MQIEELYSLYLQHPSIKTDHRKVVAGDIFIALKGPNFNGNNFARQAIEAGALFCITDEETDLKDSHIIVVEDCITSLQALARTHRQRLKIPFIAITGSNGKTTTKELVHEVLSAKYKCYTTEGNLNNHIGVPLTILKIKPDAEIAVVEMGANHLREIAGYCEYALPTHGNITNCGKAHLEGFGSEANIIKGKAELYDFLRTVDGTIFINNDYNYLEPVSEGVNHKVTYGTGKADVTGKIVNDNEFLEVEIVNGAALPSIKTNLVGGYNLPNILTAVCIGKYFDVPEEAIKTALENYKPSNSRSQLINFGTNKVILDAYNANPTSMKAAIENFAKMEGDKKVLVIGSMMELGAEADNEHEAIVKLIQQYTWHRVLLAGNGYKLIPESFIHVEDSTEAAAWFKKESLSNARILIKGSRSMQMEKLLG